MRITPDEQARAAEAAGFSRRFPFALSITDPGRPDDPLVFVSDAFERVTGYVREDVLGRNCRFLQGPGTDPDDIEAIREALARNAELQIDVLNYRADGTAFVNRLLLGPLLDEDGRLDYRLGILFDTGDRAPNMAGTADAMLAEVQHRVKNHLSMIVGMIRLQAQATGTSPRDGFQTLARRVEALQLLYHEMSISGMAALGHDRIALGAYLSRIAATVGQIDGRADTRIEVSTDETCVTPDIAARLGLLFSEVLTNALRHAFDGERPGLVATEVRTVDGVLHVIVSDDGRGLPREIDWPDRGGLGGSIVSILVKSLHGSIAVTWPERGTAIRIGIPLVDP